MKVKPGYKQTEVGVIPEEWDVAQISDVCRLVNGRGFKPFEWQITGLPIIRIQNLNGSEDFNYYSGQYNPKILIEHGQLLFAWSGSRGTSFGPHVWNGGRALLNYHTWKVEVNESSVTPNFLLYALRQLTSYIEDRAHGASALVHTQKWEMEKFPIVKPMSLPEQRAIAEALSDVDGLLGGLDRLIAKKSNLKQAAMQQLLTGQTRLPGFHGDWEVKRLGEILKVRHGKSQHGITATDGKYPILASGGEIGRTNAYIYDKPSVLIGRKGTIDCPQYVASPFWTVDTLFFTEVSMEADAKFVFYKFTMIRWRSYNEASGVPSLNAKTIENIEIETPPLPEQTAIAEVLTEMDAELVALERRREKTRALKQAMMQELLTGKTRLVPHKEAHA